MIDFGKLAQLREAQERRHSEYRRLSEAARQATADAARLRTQAIVNPDDNAARYLSLPADELAQVPDDHLTAAGVDSRLVRRVLQASERAARLRAEAEAAAAAHHGSRALLDRLNAYARQYETL